MVIFTRTFDLLAWLLPHTNHFPRAHRHTVTQRLLDAALDLREFLEEAQLRRGAARQERLARADEAIAKLRLYLRLATKLGWQTPQQNQLNPFDHFIKRELRCPGYLRYVDDFVLFSDDKRRLWEWKAALVDRLARPRLTVHPGAHPRPVTEGIPFLGFTVYPHRRRLKRRKGVHFQRKLWMLLAQCQAGEIPVSSVTTSVRSWVNHASYANTVGLRKATLSRIRLRPLRREKQITPAEARS